MSVHRTRKPTLEKHQASNLMSGDFLNGYEITNAHELSWPVRLYSVGPIDHRSSSHDDRGEAKNAMFELRQGIGRQYCKGWGFIVDISEDKIVVPASWQIPPNGMVCNGFAFTLDREFVASASVAAHRTVVEGILRDGLKKHFKDHVPTELGELWQDYGSFCQLPTPSTGRSEFHFCRRFRPTPERLRNGLWAIRVVIDTATLDGRTLAEYYSTGQVKELAALLEAKRANRLNRSNKPTDIRVWRKIDNSVQSAISVLSLDDVGRIIGHASFSRSQQQELMGGVVPCRPFKRAPIDVPMDEIRLVLDSQITQADHEETIIDPQDRYDLMESLRQYLEGADIFGPALRLSKTPLDVGDFPNESICPPPIHVRDKDRGFTTLRAPKDFTAEDLKTRAKARAERLREHGFLQSRPINPLLAVPKWFRDKRARRMERDLNWIWRAQGIDFAFNYILYDDIDALAHYVSDKGHDAVLAVLPENSRQGFQLDDTHERLKARLDVVSQCIYNDNTLPSEWIDRPWKELKTLDARLARRIKQRYELCLANLLVKHHWIPFRPSNAFNYNVHVGIDVGGRHNTTAMLCVGHGFGDPDGDIVFRPDEIAINVQQKEPIPTECLLTGLRTTFRSLRSGLSRAGVTSDFNSMLFFRDGHLLGDGDEWNEIEALQELHADFLKRGFIRDDAVWTAVEVLKHAEGWRMLRADSGCARNPIVGRAVFPFEREDTGLICTTGAPYLPQGTACPLKIRVVDIAGQSKWSDVVQDLVWEADMCFSKPDMGMRLPWILHVADVGALHKSRNYRINGIPA